MEAQLVGIFRLEIIHRLYVDDGLHHIAQEDLLRPVDIGMVILSDMKLRVWYYFCITKTYISLAHETVISSLLPRY